MQGVTEQRRDLFDNVQIQRRNIFVEVIRKYVLITHREEISQRPGGHNHDTNLMNAFMNAFSEEWGFPSVTEGYVNKSIVTAEDKKKINSELKQAITQDSITDRLATDYLKKIKGNIKIEADGTVNFISANNALEKFAKYYGLHDLDTVFSVNEDFRVLGVTTDSTAVKVTIAQFFSQENSNRKPQANTFPLTWSAETLVSTLVLDDDQEKKLWRSGDLFWNELTKKYRDKTIIHLDKTIMLPAVQDLGEKYINEVGSSQLLEIIRQTHSEEGAVVLNKIKPEKLNVASTSELSLFLSKLDTDGSVTNAMEYAKHASWFRILVEKTKGNPLMAIALKRFSDEKLAALFPDGGLLDNISQEQAERFFTRLNTTNDRVGADRAIQYAKKYPDWFNNLLSTTKGNPLLSVMLEHSSDQDLAALSLAGDLLDNISQEQAKTFFSRLDTDGSAINVIKYMELQNDEFINYLSGTVDGLLRHEENYLLMRSALTEYLAATNNLIQLPLEFLHSITPEIAEQFYSTLTKEKGFLAYISKYKRGHELQDRIMLRRIFDVIPDDDSREQLLAMISDSNSNRDEIVSWLLGDKSLQDLDLDENGTLDLPHAIKNNNPLMLEIFLEAGLGSDSQRNGDSAQGSLLHEALIAGQDDTVAIIERKKNNEILEILLSHGVVLLPREWAPFLNFRQFCSFEACQTR